MRPTADAPPSCSTPKPGRTLSLPVLKATGGGPARNAWSGGHPTIGHSKVGKWRAGVLILIHVIIVAHVIQWLVTGLTLSPVEPSESMHSLRTGAINAGFVMFVLAIGSTLLLGRFFCGWACHVVALQDLCGWLMSKARVKPKPFRSRLLVYVPLLLALYMFVWPVVHRDVVRPLFSDAQGRLPVWLGQSEPLTNIRTEFLVEDFWATFPTWYVAIPFLLVIGFACVYVLGAKGFCTYGCPYGGLFGPADLVAPGKIRVHEDRCHQCGHCTAVCTSNVRVHEEVRDFGMVTDPGCMKCLDCISVCPNDALYFGVGKPTVLAKPKKGREESAAKARVMRDARYDLSRGEEWAIGLLFFALFMCFRGMLYQVPMLMAVGMAGIVCAMVVKSWRMLTEPSVRLQSLQLKLKGSIRPWGYATLLATLLLLASAAWSGFVRTHLFMAELAYATLETPIAYVLRPDFSPTADERSAAESALKHYRVAGPPSQGGMGWTLRADDLLNIAYVQTLLGDLRGAEATMARVIREGKPRDSLVGQYAQVMQARGATRDEVFAMYRTSLELQPTLSGVRNVLAGDLVGRGKKTEATALVEAGLKTQPHNIDARFNAATYFTNSGDTARARDLIAKTVTDHNENPDVLLRAARAYAALQDRDAAVAHAALAAEASRRDSALRAQAAGLLAQLGESEKALMESLRGVDRARQKGRWLGKANVLFTAGMTQIGAGKTEEGLKLVREAVGLSAGSAWDLAQMGNALVAAGRDPETGERHPPLLAAAISALTAARDAEPASASVRYDLAVAYYTSGLRDQAIPEMQAAAEAAKDNAFLAERCAQLFNEAGQSDAARKWFEEAERRKKPRVGG